MIANALRRFVTAAMLLCAALADPGLRQRLAEQGGDIVQDPSGAAYALFVAAEAARWDGVVKAAGITAE